MVQVAIQPVCVEGRWLLLDMQGTVESRLDGEGNLESVGDIEFSPVSER